MYRKAEDINVHRDYLRENEVTLAVEQVDLLPNEVRVMAYNYATCMGEVRTFDRGQLVEVFH